MNQPDKYDVSFIAASLRLPELLKAGQSIKDNVQVDKAEDFGRGKLKTGRLLYSKLCQRLKLLTPQQFELFLNNDLIAQKQLGFLALCKCHEYIREFTIEVIREKYLLFDYEITLGEYLTFYRNKRDLYSSMEVLTEGTQTKMKFVTFKILEEAGLIDNTKNKFIQTQIIDQEVLSAIIADNPEWLKIFLMSDIDINIATESYHAH